MKFWDENPEFQYMKGFFFPSCRDKLKGFSMKRFVVLTIIAEKRQDEVEERREYWDPEYVTLSQIFVD